MEVPGANVILYIGYLVSVGISVQAIGFRPWFLMLLEILDSGSLMRLLKTTVVVFFRGVFFCLQIDLKSEK